MIFWPSADLIYDQQIEPQDDDGLFASTKKGRHHGHGASPFCVQ